MKSLAAILKARFAVSPSKWIGCMLVCAIFWTDAGLRAAEASREDQLKAAFLYNFTKFVEWPETSFQNPDDPILLGVLGKSPLQSELEKVVENRKVGDRGLVVKSVATVDEAANVHVLIVGEQDDRRVREWLGALSDSSVLTVGESAEFERHGGIITFVQENDKLRFNINAASAEKSGIKMSSQLLKLAKTVNKR